MFALPRLRQIHDAAARRSFALQYEAASGLPIPDDYLLNSTNQVFGLFYKKQLVGGFMLGQTTNFRTLDVFAKECRHPELFEEMGQLETYSEICCFFIKREFRTHTRLNLATWLSMTYAIRRYGKAGFVFGTCSRSLARLYSQTHETIPFHEDYINGKNTFVFRASRKTCVKGMLEIMRHKLQRIRALKRRQTQNKGPVAAWASLNCFGKN